MKITEEVRIELLSFQLTVEDVELVAPDDTVESRPEFVLVRFAKHKGEDWKLSELSFMHGNRIRPAWPCPVPDDVQAWVDRKLIDLRGGWPVKV